MGQRLLRHPHLKDILHLPLFTRLTHKVTRRHVIAWLLGIVLMLLGSLVASLSHHTEVLPPVVLEAIGNFLHAVGALPIIRHIEPKWLVLAGSAE